MCHDVLGEVLEEEYTEGRQRFLDFTTAYGDGKNDKKIEELILKIYEYSRSYPDAKKWIHDCAESYWVKVLSTGRDRIYPCHKRSGEPLS